MELNEKQRKAFKTMLMAFKHFLLVPTLAEAETVTDQVIDSFVDLSNAMSGGYDDEQRK